MENLSASMLACGSELRLSLRRIIFALDLGSASSDSDFVHQPVDLWQELYMVMLPARRR